MPSRRQLRWILLAALLLVAAGLAVRAVKRRHNQWEYLSSGKPYSIRTVPDPDGSGDRCLRFELRKGDVWVNKGGATFRAEIETPEHPPMNSVRWYRFALRLPRDFPIEDNRLVLAQWHGTDKRELGEPSRIPVMALRFRNSELSVTMRHSSERIVRDPDAVPHIELFRTTDFPLDTWNDFIVQAKWSYTSEGFINLWWNGMQVVQYRGPVGYNDDLGPYFQFGIYRDESDKTYLTYMKNIRMGERPQDVGFRSQ